jgi:Uri superfamily endonuclease
MDDGRALLGVEAFEQGFWVDAGTAGRPIAGRLARRLSRLVRVVEEHRHQRHRDYVGTLSRRVTLLRRSV